MALNLLRNSRLFFTTNVDATTGVVSATTHTASTTFEISVLEGFTFSQNSNSEAITVSEAGTTPSRGQRSFNTSLAPVDFSFSTYMRPYKSTTVKSEDSGLWNALVSGTPQNTVLTKAGTFTSATYTAATNTFTITGTGMSITNSGTPLAIGDEIAVNGIVTAGAGTASTVKQVTGPARVTAYSATTISFVMHNPSAADVINTNINITSIQFYKSGWSESTIQSVVGLHDSNRNQLQKAGLIVIVDNVTYQIDNAAMTQATIDFGLDGIATIQWTGQATALTQLATQVTAAAGTFGGPITGTYTQKVAASVGYITNKLSTATLRTAKQLGSIVANTPYYIAITGGSITISNNISYVTPANLGTVNLPATYYTGTRAISGNLTAYLNTGAVAGFAGGGTGNLLKDMLAAAATAIEPMFTLELAIGGSGNALKVELQMPSVSIAVPTVDVQAVISTSIAFTAAASELTGVPANDVYDLTRTNDLTVRYYAP